MAGRPPKEKSFANMLNIAVKAPGKTGEPKLREIAEKLVDLAVDGEAWAVKEVADRIDGKVGLSLDDVSGLTIVIAKESADL